MFLFHQLQTPSCKDFLSFSTNTKIACSLGWVHFINYFIVYCSFNKLTVHCVCKFMVNCPALLSLLITIHFPTNALPSCGVGLQFHSVNPSFAYWIIVWLWRPLLKCRQGLSSVVELPVRWHCLLLSSGPSSNSCESIIQTLPPQLFIRGKSKQGWFYLDSNTYKPVFYLIKIGRWANVQDHKMKTVNLHIAFVCESKLPSLALNLSNQCEEVLTGIFFSCRKWKTGVAFFTPLDVGYFPREMNVSSLVSHWAPVSRIYHWISSGRHICLL